MEVELSEIAEIFNGKDYKTNPPGDTVPIYGTGGLMGFTSKHLYTGPAVLSGRKGTINNPLYVEGDFWNVDTIFCITAKAEIETKWLYYNFLNTDLSKLNEATGVPSITSTALYKLRFRWFDKPEQTLISTILSTADEAITHTESLIAKYQRIKTGLMQDLLTKGIDEQGNIRSKATHKFVVKNGMEVPVEWEVCTIGEISEHLGSGVTPKGGSNVYIHSGIMLIRSQNVLTGDFDFSDVAFISDEVNSRMKRSELQGLDVLLNITGASIGRSHFLPTNFSKANVNQHVCAIRLKNKSIGKSLFLSTYLNDFKGQNQIKKLLGASNREGLNYQQIREIKVGMPRIESDDEFVRIANTLSTCNSSIQSFEINLSKLHSLKTGLMQDLLSGRVRVKMSEL